MSKKKLPVSSSDKQTDNPKVLQHKKPGHKKKKITPSTRVKPANKNLIRPTKATRSPKSRSAPKTPTFFVDVLDPDAFLLDAEPASEASFSESSLAISPGTLEPDSFLLADYAGTPLPSSIEDGETSSYIAPALNGAALDNIALDSNVEPELAPALNGAALNNTAPDSIEAPALGSEAPYSVEEWYPEGKPLSHSVDIPFPYSTYKPWYVLGHLGALRKVGALCLLALLIASSLLLWSDFTDTHLYIYTLDPSSGEVLGQQDIGGGYQGKTTITNPVQLGSTLVIGVHTAQTSTQVKQQILTLSGRQTTWHIENQFIAPLTHGMLSVTPNGHLVVENASGLQVMKSDGHLLWSIQGDQPVLGAHAFQPALDNETLYTLRSARIGEVAAYDLANGTLRWLAMLDDSFDYSPPLLLSGDILYIAGDHNLYALNPADGSVLWWKRFPSRSLFTLNNGHSSLLLAVGAQGLAAFDSATGAPIWAFDGQPEENTLTGSNSLTAAQFYQASVDSQNNVIYATGIVWDTQQVREQLWLYAVDGTTGNLRWSEPVGLDFTSADAGRTFTPLVDTDDGLVTLEQKQDNGDYSINAFDATDGSSRWVMHFDGETASAPTLLQVSSNILLSANTSHAKKRRTSIVTHIPGTVLILLNTQSSITTALNNWSRIRILLTALFALSLLGLLLLWILPLHLWIQRQRDHIHNIPRYLIYPLKLLLRLWRFSHRVFVVALIILILGGGWLEYAHLNQPENALNSIAASTGGTRWQRINTSPMQTMLADAQGSIDSSTAGDQLHQLSGLDNNGVSQWTTLVSEGVFSAPSVSTQPGTALVALSGPTTLHYQFAPDDPAYPHPQEHILNLYLLNRGTGQIIWRSAIVRPGQQQNAVVLGADGRFIYVASRETNAAPNGQGSTVQLIAVNSTTGTIEWRIFGPQEANDAPVDYGSLLLKSRLIIWQVAGTIYNIDTTLGQIQWRRLITEDDANALLQEERQMAEAAGVLVVERSNVFHILDTTSGNELQTMPNPGTGPSPSVVGVMAIGNILLIYGGQTLEAIDPTSQQIIWQQNQFDAIKGLKVSDDDTTIYVVLQNTIDIGMPIQEMAALDLKTGAVRWTFQPSSQATFVDAQSDGFQYHKGTLFATICLSDAQTSCARERLYAINAATGEALWKIEAKSIFDLHVSLDGETVLFQTNSSEWINLIGRFKS